MKNFDLLFLTGILLILLFSACGLYSYPYVEAPDVVVASPSSPKCTIKNASGNDSDIFRGYEIYYKFYNQSTAYEEHKTDHNKIFSKEEPDYTALLANGYRRCMTIKNIKKETTKPMIPVPGSHRTDNFEIEIDFTNAITISSDDEEELQAEFSYDHSKIPLYRNIEDQNPETTEVTVDVPKIYKDFNSKDLKDNIDADMPSADVSLSMYILSYGIYENSTNLYSKPVWLGYVDCH